MFKFKSLYTRLWLAMSLLVLLAFGIFLIFQWQLMQGFYFSQQAQRMADSAKQLAGMISSARTPEEIKQQVSLISQFLGADIIILSRSDLESSQIPGMMGMMRGRGNDRSMLSRDDFIDLLNGKTVVDRPAMPMHHINNIVAATPVVTDQQITGAVVIHMPASKLRNTVSVLNTRTLWLAALLILISMLFALWLSSYISKPLVRMKNAALDIAAGRFDKKVDLKTYDELGQLASAINYMSSQLEQLDQLRRDLVANVSHELRTPLALIRGYAEAIQDEVADNIESQKQYNAIILDEARRLEKLVNNLLDLSLLETGALTIKMQPFSISRLIKDMHLKFAPIAQKKGITLSIKIEKNIVTVGDEGRIEQVLFNLIQNAINHTPTGGTVIISAEAENNKTIIKVSDTGYGISPKDLPNIFKKFYKGSKDPNGAGLGLAIARGIITAHGSDIWVNSKENEGTTFGFWLPLHYQSRGE